MAFAIMEIIGYSYSSSMEASLL